MPQSLAARLQVFAPVDAGLANFLDQLEVALRSRDGDEFEDEDLDPDTPPGLAPIGVPQACMQALVQDFSRRQRQATMLVAGCVAAWSVLTVVGIITLANFAGRAPMGSEIALSQQSSSAAWQRQPPETPTPIPVSAHPNRSGKSDALLVQAHLEPEAPAEIVARPRSPAPELILMQADRPLSLGPLIDQHRARYILIRGLPSEAKLSAGQRNPTGAWLVKDQDIGALTLSISGGARGDYATEIYALGSGALPQGRQRLVFRVDGPGPMAEAAGWQEHASLIDSQRAEGSEILASLSD